MILLNILYTILAILFQFIVYALYKYGYKPYRWVKEKNKLHGNSIIGIYYPVIGYFNLYFKSFKETGDSFK